MDPERVDRPHYGWYHRGMTIGLVGIGLGALILFFLSFPLRSIGRILRAIVGILVVITCLWPGLGLLFINVVSNRWFYLAPKMNQINALKKPQILDIGCGTGRTTLKIAKALENGGHLLGIDIFDPKIIDGNSLETIQRNAELEGVANKTSFQYGSALDIPFDDEKFDFITSSFVIHEFIEHEHWKKNDEGITNQVQALREIHRVLKPGGYVFIMEFYRPSVMATLLLGPQSFVFPKASYWQRILNDHGFQNISVDRVGPTAIFAGQKAL